MKKFINYYGVLEVDNKAPIDEIRTSYKKLVKMYHPDSGNSDEEKIRLINEAYSVLSDKKRREEYDLEYEYRIKNNLSEEEDLSIDDIIKDLSDIDKVILERLTYKKVIRDRLGIMNQFFNKKTVLFDASLNGDFSNEEFNSKQKELMQEYAKIKEEFFLLREEAKKKDMYDLVDEINDAINYLDQSIEDIPDNLTDLIYEDRQIRLKNAFEVKIRGIINDYSYALQELKNLGLSLYKSEITKEEYLSILHTLRLNIDENKNVISSLSEILNDKEFVRYKNDIDSLDKLNEMLSFFVLDDFVTAIERVEYLYLIENMNDKIVKYLTVDKKKIEKISNIIAKYPDNHHSKNLYKWVLEYYDDLVREITNYSRIYFELKDGTTFGEYKYFYTGSSMFNFQFKKDLEKAKESFEFNHEPVKITKSRPFKNGRVRNTDGSMPWKLHFIKNLSDYVLIYKILRMHVIYDPVLFLASEILLWNGANAIYTRVHSEGLQILIGFATLGLAFGEVIGGIYNFIDNNSLVKWMKYDIENNKYLKKVYKKK